ncbi:hypothetical protein DL897_09760 [Thermoflavimicrobium daqui]|uniref:DNA-directed RNA polymerase subunit beta n=2 Tax=Thermoflavimicrobium daqui TaxID=2137476 RepID=A0A364K5E0_9BACL|nr:hypothetical protein DL897_09760 [Thermoflavimicrobium daqui]
MGGSMESAKDKVKKQTDTLLSVGELKWSEEEEKEDKKGQLSDQEVEKKKEPVENKKVEEIQDKEVDEVIFNSQNEQPDDEKHDKSTERLLQAKEVPKDTGNKPEELGSKKQGKEKKTNGFEENTFVRFDGFATEDDPLFQSTEKEENPKQIHFEQNKVQTSVPSDPEVKAIDDTHLFNQEYEQQIQQPSAPYSKPKSQPNEEQQQEKKSASKKVFKILWLPVILIVILIVGLIIGHTVLGKQPIGDIFDMKMWDHLYRLIFTK